MEFGECAKIQEHTHRVQRIKRKRWCFGLRVMKGDVLILVEQWNTKFNAVRHRESFSILFDVHTHFNLLFPFITRTPFSFILCLYLVYIGTQTFYIGRENHRHISQIDNRWSDKLNIY